MTVRETKVARCGNMNCPDYGRRLSTKTKDGRWKCKICGSIAYEAKDELEYITVKEILERVERLEKEVFK